MTGFDLGDLPASGADFSELTPEDACRVLAHIDDDDIRVTTQHITTAINTAETERELIARLVSVLSVIGDVGLKAVSLI